MQEHTTTACEVRQDVVRAVALYKMRHGIHCTLADLPRRYVPRYRHDLDGHADERVFLDALSAHPQVTALQRTTAGEDELLGVDALVTVGGNAAPVPIDFTTRGRAAPGGAANIHATLRRGVIPVVMEEVPTDLTPAQAYAAFQDWRARGEEFLQAVRPVTGTETAGQAGVRNQSWPGAGHNPRPRQRSKEMMYAR